MPSFRWCSSIFYHGHGVYCDRDLDLSESDGMIDGVCGDVKECMVERALSGACIGFA